MHDDKLGRTATGQGVVSALTTAQLRTEKLKDEFGNVTAFQIPFLKDVLSWCKTNKGYLMLDFKKGISYQKVVDLVRRREDGSASGAYQLLILHKPKPCIR